MRLGFQFTLDDLIAKVRELVSSQPNTTYERAQPYSLTKGSVCSYILGTSTDHDTGFQTPGCLFGQLLPLEWVELDESRRISDALRAVRLGSGGYENDPGNEMVVYDGDLLIRGKLEDELPYATKQKLRWLRSVQAGQDSGELWGDAVEYADRHYPLA